MIRIPTDTGWLLINHRDHARLAGEFGRHWGNFLFPQPDQRERVLVAVSRHDDAWISRDAEPFIAPDGTPSAFSSELVGTYSAFENIDLEAYLAVRGAATERVADHYPLAAILISMHTVNLLTEQADLSGLSDEDRQRHAKFVARQRSRQQELKEILGDDCPDESFFQRSFEFLQACDSFSLITCVQYPDAIPLRHKHPTDGGSDVLIHCIPQTKAVFRIDPYPLYRDPCEFLIPATRIEGKTFSSDAALRDAFKNGQPTELTITVHR